MGAAGSFNSVLSAADINISEAAGEKLSELFAEVGDEMDAIRIFVSGGGCSGMSYGMTFSEGAELGDQTFDLGNLKVVVDPGSIQYLDGAEIDYLDSLMGGGFRIENPNAVRSCACGSSFQTAAGERGTPCSQ